MSFLEFQDEIYLNVVNDSACLIVTSRGIGLEQLMVRLCRTYSDDTNLVIVIGTNQEEQQFFVNQLIDESSLPIGNIPQCITFGSSTAKKRREVYLKGGVFFVTERILITDLLLDRVPIDLVTGFIVYNAHRMYDDCLMPFILRLYRLKNKKGFVKALSQEPQSFIGEFGKLDRIMKSLFVSTLHLWPRFHASAQASLKICEPKVIEICLDMSERMKKIQFCIIDLIEGCLRELSKTNTNFLIDFDKLNVENALTMPFNKFVRLFDSVWHQLSSRSKRLIHDIQWLRHLLHLLTQSDVVTFYTQTKSAQESVRLGSDISDWIFWTSADQLFRLSKERVYLDPNSSQPNPEANSKWEAFENLIDEIDEETAEIKDCVNVIVIVATDQIIKILQKILRDGAKNVLLNRLDRFNAIRKGCQMSAESLEFMKVGEQTGDNDFDSSHSNQLPVKKRSRTTKNPSAEVQLPDNIITMTQIFERRSKIKSVETINIEDEHNNEDITLIEHISPEKTHQLKLHYFTARDRSIILESLLKAYEPSYIIMYDLEMESMRKLEIYSAIKSQRPNPIKLYILQFKDSFDMQMYLTVLKREKEAFEKLIREKATMVVPSGRDGKTDGHPDLIRSCEKANETTDSASTRVGGGVINRSEIFNHKILVDLREFRCELPSVIHKRGIEIEPVHLEIGDYILSPDTCVERKSISDLIQSLQSGRLFTQASAMIKHFTRPILLIEFDGNKSFHFKGRYICVGMGYDSYKSKEKRVDLVERLILLTIHQPKLGILWSPSAHFTAELFEYLKLDKEQPDSTKIIAISSNELVPESFQDKYDVEAREFLLKLPGVNSRNVYGLMNRIDTLANLVDLSIEEIEEILGNSKSGKLFYDTLHTSFSKLASEAISLEQQSKKSRLFSCTAKRKARQ